MTPIEKNIIVVDENGNEYEATYPKRAKGLVKNGRARFISENKICLACPPDMITEDNEMSENTNVNASVATENTTITQSAEKLTIDYILTQIEKIMVDTAHINEALNTIEQIGDTGSGDARPGAAADIVRCRETTNQEVLRFYREVYNDLKRETISTKDRALEAAKVLFAAPGVLEQATDLLHNIDAQ